MRRRAFLLAPATFAPCLGQAAAEAEPGRSILLDVAVAYVLGQPSAHPYAAVLDFSRHSSQARFHILERAAGDTVASFLVAHGSGSEGERDDGHAEQFSNTPDSEQSSLGLYRTGATYLSAQQGHGLSMRLHGLSESNSLAFERLIVIHAHAYMEPEYIAREGRPGRSEGCMVFSGADRDTVVRMLRGGALILAVKDLESLED